MAHLLAGILALMQLLTPSLARQDLPGRLRSGQWLRFHVVAHDDTPEMQRLKLEVRDAVQACYAAAPACGTMLQNAAALLPQLTEAARKAAQSAGFTGEVEVTLGEQSFGERTLMGVPIPAGTYPALMIHLGEARGHNWWGLLDPSTSLSMAVIGDAEDGEVLWDWSWAGLLAALFGLQMPGA